MRDASERSVETEDEAPARRGRLRLRGVVDALAGRGAPSNDDETSTDEDAADEAAPAENDETQTGSAEDASAARPDATTARGDAATALVATNAPADDGADDASGDWPEHEPTSRNWGRASREAWIMARAAAVFIVTVMLTFWPAMTAIGLQVSTGSLEGWSPIAAYPAWALVFALILPAMVLAFGYLVSRQMAMMHAAERIAEAARVMTQPDKSAVFNVESVGAAVRTQVDCLTAGVDDALIRLASVEAMIRDHVGAIETAGSAIESRASGAVEKVVEERTRLIGLTEHLNEQADAFAVAIAEKAQASVDSLTRARSGADEAEAKLSERFQKLEAAAQNALLSFEALSNALGAADGKIAENAGAIEAAAGEARKATERAVRVAEEAAESAARNAVNVGQFSRRATEEAKSAAEQAIAAARFETSRVAEAAVAAADGESERVRAALVKNATELKEATEKAAAAASEDAGKAADAAERLTSAATHATEAATSAASAVEAAGAAAEANAARALETAEAAAARADERQRQLIDARASLERENERLEALIEEQRRRADRLADAIANQTERLSKLAEAQLREQEAAVRLSRAHKPDDDGDETRSDDARDESRAPLAPENQSARDDAPVADEADAPATGGDAGADDDGVDPAAIDQDGEDKAGDSVEDQEEADDAAPTNDGLNGETRPDAPRAARSDGRANVRRAAGRVDAARLDALARTIERRGPRGQARGGRGASKDGVSWREILTATDDAGPIDLATARRETGPDDREAERQAVKVVHRLQNFTLNVERRLYGEPPDSLLERFDGGDRNVFANRLLQLNEADVKRRIRAEFGRDKTFERALHEFLQGFEGLLEAATTSDTADEELEQYLSSPLGRVYLLIGATVGYFS